MKTTDVIVKIHTVSRSDVTEKFDSEFSGTLTQKDGGYYVTYTDTEPNIIIIKGDTVKISKPHSQSVLTFKQNCERVSSYATPAGRMAVSVFTNKLLNEFETQRRVFIKYTLTFNETVTTNNDITIKIEEK